MSRFMDKEGFLRDEELDQTKQIKRFEKMLITRLEKGGSIPEAVFDIMGILEVATGNVRYRIITETKERRREARRQKKECMLP